MILTKPLKMNAFVSSMLFYNHYIILDHYSFVSRALFCIQPKEALVLLYLNQFATQFATYLSVVDLGSA